MLWAAAESRRLPSTARDVIEDQAKTLPFSAASLWEFAIEGGSGRADCLIDARLLREPLRDRGHFEIAVLGAHATAVASLPAIQRDPFDRLLIVQAIAAGLRSVTPDRIVARYGAVIPSVRVGRSEMA
ncbi:type II toxin-antitoxin system VapC family toxin [Methylobacterium sp. J-030]|nr:type II toxin-antitoxin system VapC family toxin [Methylobacterium sp. J-030]